MKPLSGSGARGMMIDTMTQYGVDSFPGRLASILQGSTETTFYVLAVYFGSVNIKNSRYAVTCGLIADFVGIVAAICMAYLFFSPE
jgi:spore maturation protein SpmB